LNEFVLPLPVYSKLLETMMADNMEILTIYGRVTDEREDAAKTLVRIMESTNNAVTFINALNSIPPFPLLFFKRFGLKQNLGCAGSDVQGSEEKTIFRANSMASKALDYYMKLIGMEYLFCKILAVLPSIDLVLEARRSAKLVVLKPIMDEIIKQERSCEIDPTRLEKGEDLEANQVVLLAYIEWTVSRIFGTGVASFVSLFFSP